MRWIEAMTEGEDRRLRYAALAAFLIFSPGCVPSVAQAPSASAPRYTVVLDAAHGGQDTGGHTGTPSGAQGGYWAEKDTTLALSVRLRSLLAARGIAMVTTRENDADVDTLRRDELANHANAQVCITLHASLSGKGVHLFTSPLEPVQPARIVPWRTAQAAWVARSLALAGVMNSALQHAGFSVTLGRTALPVVDSMACPAVAVEVSPDSSASSTSGLSPADSLNDQGYQARVVEALAAAIVEWRSPESGGGAGQP